jgi:hypothetical protein
MNRTPFRERKFHRIFAVDEKLVAMRDNKKIETTDTFQKNKF